MSALSVFLAENVKKEDAVKYVASKRFLADDGKPVFWEIGTITSKEDDDLRRRATKMMQVPEKKGQYARETDYNEYMCRLAARCTLFPNLNDAQLQDSYKVVGAEQLLQVMLTPGEYQRYIYKVQEINGFDMGMEEMIDEAKN